ncbi:acyl-CoA dehydrogenase family protein [Bordetella muralis]|uniref:acyl-CoA dehydrogenase family protein n=1 Tax=Bordetella muralis TaxID=1649130 RepID=UPI0039F10958
MPPELNSRYFSLLSDGHRESGQDAAFRAELRQFAQAHCPDEIRQIVASGEKITRPVYSKWQAILYQRGWAAPNWPVEYGGTGWSLRQRMIFEEVMADLDCPPLYHHGLGHIGPVIMQFGTDAQKSYFLPRILDTTDWWCQGYSEPGSGSDLASLSTPAVRDGDHYVINGQKIWTSHAHEADRIYLLARTSREAKKQEGISLFLIDMNTPGITVRPIRTIDGWHHVNETFLDNVRVPADRLLGTEGQGWACAKYLLERERLPPASVSQLIRQWRRVARLLAEHQAKQPLRDFSSLEHQMAMLSAQIKGAREMLASAIDAMMRREPLGAKPSALKQACSAVAQSLTKIALLVAGPIGAQQLVRNDEASTTDGLWVQNYLFSRSKTIAGGTTEIQLNVIAKSLFGA